MEASTSDFAAVLADLNAQIDALKAENFALRLQRDALFAHCQQGSTLAEQLFAELKKDEHAEAADALRALGRQS